jgi:ABC-type antimicrobial peptide transport system permease subunit
VVDGRLPADDGEISLGTRMSESLAAGIGDQVHTTGPDGVQAPLRVVGIVLIPPFDGGPLGDTAVVTTSDRETMGLSEPLNEAVVVPVPGTDVDALMAEYASTWELYLADRPPEVRNLVDLGDLPLLLGLFLAVVGMAAMANAVLIAVRRHRTDLTVLGALGFTRGQIRGVIIGTAVTAACVGILIGVPLGLAIGRFVWWAAAADAGLGTSIDVPVLAVSVTIGAVALAAVVAALYPGRLAHRDPGLDALRVE